MNIFVYGTLMTGLQRQRALSRSHFIGNGTITGELYDLGRFPALVKGDSNVLGEVYEISEQTLNMLDQIESYDPDNHQESLYVRQAVNVHLDSSGEPISAESYYYNRSIKGRGTLIVGGDYRAFLDEQGFLNWL